MFEAEFIVVLCFTDAIIEMQDDVAIIFLFRFATWKQFTEFFFLFKNIGAKSCLCLLRTSSNKLSALKKITAILPFS